MCVSLIQVARFLATKNTFTSKSVIKAIKSTDKVSKKSRKIWTSILEIPEILATSNGFSKIISVFYKLEFSFSSSGLSAKAVAEAPLSNYLTSLSLSKTYLT